MKTTAKFLVGFLTLGLALGGLRVPLAAGQSEAWVLMARQAVGQFGGSDNDRRKEAAKWLEQAREAMKSGNLDLAEDYVGRAEKLDVKYDSLFSRFVDTPAKVRKDLQDQRAKGANEPPSSRFSPTGGKVGRQPAMPPKDPNADVTELALNTLTNDNKAKAQAALNEGRAALAANNVPAAIAAYQKAVAEKAKFGPAEYSPESLAAQLRTAGVDTSRIAPAAALADVATPDDFARLDRGQALPSAPRDNTNLQNSPFRNDIVNNPLDLERRGAARSIGDGGANESLPTIPGGVNAGMLDQGGQHLLTARQSLARGDLNRAMQAIAQAKVAGGNFAASGDSPEKVEALVRRASRFSTQPTTPEGQATFARELAGFMMDQAEQLLPYGDVETARQLVGRVKSLPVQYDAGQRTPDMVLAAIDQRARQVANQAPNQFADGGQPARLPTPTSQQTGTKAQAARLLSEAQLALDKGDLASAERLARQAEGMNVPNREFTASELQPWQVLLEIDRRKNRFSGYPVAQASANMPVDQPGGNNYAVAQGVYRSDLDNTRVAQASQVGEPTPAQPLTNDTVRESSGMNLYQQGLRALANQDRDTALQLFREAWQFKDELDPYTQQQLKDKLTLMRTVNQPAVNNVPQTPLEEVDSRQEVLRQKLVHEITNEVAQARKTLPQAPREAYQQLERLRMRVSQSELEPNVRKQLLTSVDRGLAEVEQFIEQNRAEIELDEANAAVLADLDNSRAKKAEVDQKLAELVEKFNLLLDERRYAEAEIIAKQIHELSPNSELAKTVIWKSRFVRRTMELEGIKTAKEEGVYGALASVEDSSTPMDDRIPFRFGDKKYWEEVTRRASLSNQAERRLSPAEMEIQRSLEKPVDVQFDQRPLAEVMDTLSRLSGVPIYLDNAGLAAEGVTSNTPITIRLSQPISLRSALTLILEELKLGYTIESEVLKISSEQVRETHVYTKTYYVADLVIPIPNFLPGYDQGMTGALREAYRTVGYGMNGGMLNVSPSAPFAMAANEGGSLPSGSQAMAQFSNGGIPGLSSRGSTALSPMGGPGGMGGGVMADFEPLIELIQTTIAPDTWDAVGGPGAVSEFQNNLSLVISQTQEVHEQIADLLDQLRRLQDLQVTIEVRFITLNDNFFERIGVDFDFDLDDNYNKIPPDDGGPSVAIGLDPATGLPTADFDIQFTQDSFADAVPQFGNFSANASPTLGFAILSDIEMFFVLQAAQGDTRTNVLQAPKVTLFNGQLATVSDTSLRPFVTSVVPVVGDFAAAQAPVIMMLSEGTNLTVQAVVSNDRRFVRLTLVPFFSQIGEVEEFTFTGSTTTRSGSNVIDPETGEPIAVDDQVIEREGTTVQQPTFSFTTVSTTVSVPDGGTVLLGGIKRLREGRIERGLPFAAQIPYVSRLFKNVGIGRETNSLMMMVTPRIIIQEEEERKLGIDVAP